MPFDLTPPDPDLDILARMELLGEIAARSEGDQSHFSTCLWRAVDLHPQGRRLLEPFASSRCEGGHTGPKYPGALRDAAAAFGLHENVFGSSIISAKRIYIASRIAALKAAIAAKTTTKQKEYA